MPEPLQIEDTHPEPDTAPTPAAPPAAEAAATAAPPAATEPEPLIDPDTADLTDERVRTGLLGEIKRLRQENRLLKPAAADAEQLRAWAHANQPYVEFLQKHPDFLAARPAAPPASATPTEDPDALEAAQLMDFYTADGKADIDKGRRWLALQDRRASRLAQQAVEPLAQSRTQAQAENNYRQLLGLKLPDGTLVRKDTVDAFWRRAAAEPNGLQTLADPQSLAGIALMVLGAEAMSRQQPVAPPSREPLVTEPSGGTPGQMPRLSDLERRVVAARGGISEKEWTEKTRGFQPGRPMILED
jgi:hypothetical protein